MGCSGGEGPQFHKKGREAEPLNILAVALEPGGSKNSDHL